MRQLFIKISGRHYLKSTRRALYEQTAKAFKVCPELVYLLAHGREPKNRIDYQICRHLYYSTHSA